MNRMPSMNSLKVYCFAIASPLSSHPGSALSFSVTCSGLSFAMIVPLRRLDVGPDYTPHHVCGMKVKNPSHERIRLMANKVVDEEARKQIGTAGEARTYDVERGAIRRFAEAIGDPNP